MSGLAGKRRIELLAIGGVEDHENKRGDVIFAWQKTYGAFSVSASQVSRTRKYILNQEEHHKQFGYSHQARQGNAGDK